MTYRILITGSRNWTDKAEIRAALICAGRSLKSHPQAVVVVHGAAKGADTLAAEVAREFGCMVEPHPADWGKHGKAAGPRRNAEMVAAGADICLAFPIGESRGTRGCMRLAEQAGIPVVVHEGGREEILGEMVQEAAALGLYESTAGPVDTR